MEEIERYERMERDILIATRVAILVSILLNIWMILSLMSDILGVDLGEIYNKIVKYGWRLPPDWVVKYHPYLYTMQWILLISAIIDSVISVKLEREGAPRVSTLYLQVMAFIAFFCGMWLYLAYKAAVYGIFFISGLLAFVYSFIRKKEEMPEETTKSEIWTEETTT